MKVLLDISKPLAKGRVINMADSHIWIPFKYEWLLSFCYHCGIILHSQFSCAQHVLDGSTPTTSQLQYGPWFRVGPTLKLAHNHPQLSSPMSRGSGSDRQGSFDDQGSKFGQNNTFQKPADISRTVPCELVQPGYVLGMERGVDTFLSQRYNVNCQPSNKETSTCLEVPPTATIKTTFTNMQTDSLALDTNMAPTIENPLVSSSPLYTQLDPMVQPKHLFMSN